MRKKHRSPPPRTPEHSARIAAANKGRVWTEASREKASRSKAGVPWSGVRRARYQTKQENV